MHPALEIIRKTPGVCGGKACIRDTRIAVWTLQQLKELGRSDEQLIEDFPSLTTNDLIAAWEYVDHHSTEIRIAIGQQGLSRD